MIDQLRAFRAHKQGLLSPLTGTPEEILTQIGWCRTVGATSPYLALMARAGLTRPTIDQALADCTIHELPSARGCAYLLPKSDFALGLACAEDPSAPITPSSPERKLGITGVEIEALMEAVLIALEPGPRDPQQLRDELGDKVRRFGDEGKKRGITTDLPGALGRLQNKGKIRRIPVNGRIDVERYAYTLWPDNPLQSFTLSREETFAQLARRYESWLGPITLAEFQWFSGLSARAAKAAFALTGIIDQGSDLWAHPETWAELQAFQAPAEKPIHLLGSIDPYFLYTKNLRVSIRPEHQDRWQKLPSALTAQDSLADLATHAIIEGGDLVGLWHYDPESKEVLFTHWASEPTGVRKAVDAMQAAIEMDLGDVRIYSLDSTKSRQAVLQALREQMKSQ
ncbi:MAG: winged helix DNA-binding domain-containing protein [Armatimonadetes bacterium]|nr:winged helix DNA-binding domain-containing protein [Armatimonadota bacterium]